MTAYRVSRFVVVTAALAMGLVLLTAPAAALEDDEVFAQANDGAVDPRADERRRANDGDWFRSPTRRGPEDFPSNEVHDAVVANARAATARAVYRRVESDLNATVRAAQRDFAQSAELREALAAEQRAYDVLLDTRRTALREVMDDPKYQAMRELREGLSQQIADRREGLDASDRQPRLVSFDTLDTRPYAQLDDDNVVAMATVKLRIGVDAAAMEREALADNDAVRQAKDDLVKAGSRVAELRDNFDRSMRANEDLKRVRDELAEARIARLTAESYRLGASLAAREALDFSYYLHRYDYYRYSNADQGYSYGYGSPRFGYRYLGSTVSHRLR